MSSDSEQEKDVLNINTINSINLQETIKVSSEKISDVPKEETISLDEETKFRFSCTVVEDKLRFRLSEIGALCPFIYENSLSLDEMRKKNTAFNATDTLDEVKKHIEKLFKGGDNVWIERDKDNSDIINMNIRILVISGPENIKIDLMKKMTTEKDDCLIQLYDIEKKGINIFKEIEEYLKKKGYNDALNKFMELKKANNL